MRYGNGTLLAVFLLVALVLALLVVALVLIAALVLVTVVLVVLAVIVVLHEIASFRPIGYRRILNRCAGKYAFFHKKKKTIDKCGDGW